MSKDDDDDEMSDITMAKFPCMPSLVALQQMRNRLHMAYVGKKLMKWTAQATGRELRKIALELTKTCHHFRDEMRESFILLSRARYFCPNLNNMVVEHIAPKAEITVDVKMKSITGVRVMRLEIIENSSNSYPHLGIEKGGQAINDARYAWRHILKRIIHMIEQRTSFVQVQDSHKGATK